MCSQCGSRFAAGVKFCGRCGGRVFLPVNDAPGSQPGSSHQPHSPGSIGGGSVVGHAATGVRCARCGTNYPPGTKFCGRCGIPIQAAAPSPAPLFTAPARPVVCHNCHTSYPPGTKFCGRCGLVIRT